MIEESTLEQLTEQPIPRPRGRPREEKPVEPQLKRPRGGPRVEKQPEPQET